MADASHAEEMGHTSSLLPGASHLTPLSFFVVVGGGGVPIQNFL